MCRCWSRAFRCTWEARQAGSSAWRAGFCGRCLAQTAAFQFLLASQDDYDDAFARYLHLSQQGGEKLWTDLLAEAGFRSPFEPGALAQLAARVEPLIRKHTV